MSIKDFARIFFERCPQKCPHVVISGGFSHIAEAIAEKPLIAAKLLAGEMPEELEEVVRSAGLDLFPTREGDLRTNCSCPDWSNPCKHIAAVYYLLAEAFDRDPFLLLMLRGLSSRDEFVALLGRAGAYPGEPTPGAAPHEPATAIPLPSDPARFWSGKPARPAGAFLPVRDPAALVRRLGPVPFWRGREEFVQAMASVYASASKASLDLLEREE